MNRTSFLLSVGAWLVSLTLWTQAAEFHFPNQTFTVPDGFEVERIAGPGLVERPITADFDEQGRLYVTDSSGSNDKVDKQLQERPHRIVRLEDTDGDGKFDKSIVFADRMMFPEGAMWFRGALYVSAPPSIWKLTDTDGDGVADHREEWFQGKTLTGCANDLHGPFTGPDGWIYWCKGAFASQTYERPGKAPFTTKASHIFRARPDGSGIEPVLTGGMDNPVSVTFTPGGERILTGTFFVHPGGGQRDGLIHAIYGGVYGKDHDVLNNHKRTGELMPIMTHHGPSASAFVLRYQSSAFGEPYRDNLFACLFNLHKVTRHVLVPSGATFTTHDEDFLTSDNPDFHPTDLLEDADGSLIVVDTGGWYKLCCPTSQLWKPDVLGAIYRVRRSGAAKPEDARGLRIAWADAAPEKLVALLDDGRLVVRQRAIEELVRRQAMGLPALKKALGSASAEGRRNALWALTRMDGPDARQAVRVGLQDTDESVRQVAVHSISVWRDAGAFDALLEAFPTAPAPLQRVMAEALGRLGQPGAIPALLRAAAAQPDRVLEHSLIYALIELDDARAVRVELAKSNNSLVKHAALIALDQMDEGGLAPEAVTPLLASTDPVLKQTATWIVRHRPEWAKTLVGFYRERLRVPDLAAEDRAEVERQLGEFAHEEAIQTLLGQVVADTGSSSAARLTAVRAMARAGLKQAPAAWANSLGRVLTANDPNLVGPAVSTAKALTLGRDCPPELLAGLRAVGQDASRPVEIRLDALAAVPGGLSEVDAPTFDFLINHLTATDPVMVRSSATAVLAKARLSPSQLDGLTSALRQAGPLEVPKLLGAFERATNEALGLKLISALKASPGLAGLRPETLQPRLTNFPDVVKNASEELMALLNVDGPKQKAHLDEVAKELKGGDVRRGQIVFNSQKAACSSCHAIGYLGGNVGPDLTRIGQIRTERDLLEAIVYPSASFVRSFEPVLVSTKSGDDFNGVVRKDTAEELVLATGPGTEARIAKSDIAEMRPGTLSVMPAGLDEQLSRQELADLIAFLRATRW